MALDFSEQLTLGGQAASVAFGALFPVLNPIGTAIILIGMTGAIDRPTRRLIARKIAINTLILLMVVLLAGSYLLSFFGITIPTVEAAGGLVLASMGWNLLKQDDKQSGNATAQTPTALSELLFYPFTFPVTVGPGSIAVALTLSAHTQHETLANTTCRQGGAILGIAAVCIIVYLSIAYADLVASRLGAAGTKVLLRLMAFVVVCLGAEIFWHGAATLIKQVLH